MQLEYIRFILLFMMTSVMHVTMIMFFHPPNTVIYASHLCAEVVGITTAAGVSEFFTRFCLGVVEPALSLSGARAFDPRQSTNVWNEGICTVARTI